MLISEIEASFSAIVECEQVLYQFFRQLDASRHDQILELFEPDGQWHRQGRSLAGKDVIRQALLARPVDRTVRHALHAVCVEATDALEANASGSLLVFWAHGLELPLRAPQSQVLVMDMRATLTRATPDAAFRIRSISNATVFQLGAEPS